MKMIITCEHGGKFIPKKFDRFFESASIDLNSHKGYDIGALDLYLYIRKLSHFAKYNKVSRLLIELNRSLHHNELFSNYIKSLSNLDKQDLIRSYYYPYRNEVIEIVDSYINSNETVLHISVHTFTPKLNNSIRNCDIGLLYDSRNSEEKRLCRNLKSHILNKKPDLKIRNNYPYLGKADGFTSYLRKKFPKNYLGIEIEVNQKHTKNNKMDKAIKMAIHYALEMSITK